jgi:hypothetical protein
LTIRPGPGPQPFHPPEDEGDTEVDSSGHPLVDVLDFWAPLFLISLLLLTVALRLEGWIGVCDWFSC